MCVCVVCVGGQGAASSLSVARQERTEALAIRREPCVWLIVFCACEDEVAFAIVFQVGESALVALEENWSLRAQCGFGEIFEEEKKENTT